MLAITATPPVPALATSGFVLALDEMHPGNVGTLIRTAAAAGSNQVWLSPGCAFAWSVKTACPGRSHFTQVVEANRAAGALAAFTGQRWATLPPRSWYGENSLAVRCPLRRQQRAGAVNEGHGLKGNCSGVERRACIPMEAGISRRTFATAGAIALYRCSGSECWRPVAPGSLWQRTFDQSSHRASLIRSGCVRCRQTDQKSGPVNNAGVQPLVTSASIQDFGAPPVLPPASAGAARR